MKLNVERELAVLQKMTTAQLCERYAEISGEQVRSRHRAYLIRKIAWRLQALAEGDLSERARRRAEELADDSFVRSTAPRIRQAEPAAGNFASKRVATVSANDTRLPAVGGAIERHYKGQRLRVVVLDNGFEYEGQRYKSLSAVAKAITGSHCNGYLFFRLGAGQ